MTMRDSVRLTALYDRWLADLLIRDIPPEKVDCSHCAMCGERPTLDEITAGRRFSPDVKCCSYWPRLPNFLVGGLLRDEESAAGRTRVLDLIGGRPDIATPLGIEPSLEYELLFHAAGVREFGRAAALRCPFYEIADGGSCTIWRHRTSVCATWYCKHVRGDVGSVFWMSVRALLQHIERSVAIWCVSQLEGTHVDLPWLEMQATRGGSAPYNAHRTLDAVHSIRDSDRMWGTWRSRKVEFYTRCSESVGGLPAADLVSIGGAQGQALAAAARTAYEALKNTAVPERPKLGRYSVYAMDANGVEIGNYNAYDHVKLSLPLFSALHYFDGSTSSEVISRLREDGIEIDPELIATLTDFRILMDAAG